MQRRDFLKLLVSGIIAGGVSPEAFAQLAGAFPVRLMKHIEDNTSDYYLKMKNFNRHHRDDIRLRNAEIRLLKSVVKRLHRVQLNVGHGNFHLLGFDEALMIAKYYPEVGAFTRAELNFLEKIFYSDASRYGFFGQKPLVNMIDHIRKKDTEKVPYTGQYMYKGSPLKKYREVKKVIGDELLLTSGIRGVMKQFLLFLDKAYRNRGNLSLASRSLAPPGYSFHSRGDFDVGQAGFGAANFTEHFTTTPVFKSLSELGYLKLRYPQKNILGVRFEPWHIKISA